ncbi:GNAT family N-acetyltransferase [Alkaliphilus hydrothermalis]|uniref:Ribosomal protein S18 acetylase RimI-like enzyme n=1 Tax=Alkaliphilus hydrothermalis TaxID=1482730 RepID=A0ABS2NLE9_9FIRM|nr:GNAT family N-acetyltransferase [Alkaliphilus hydrothermalis]MBM7613762.1 ribosomal protein S18 acetylase RimI-like enzyme [Alkaliphilus hydrothermalis]
MEISIVYRKPISEEINKISEFIAVLNSQVENHIGYCGDVTEEIAYSIKEDLTDLAFEDSFVIAVENGVIVGVVGIDVDIENTNVEMWGPFTLESKWDIVENLWTKILERIPPEIETISMFLNKKNIRCIDFAISKGFKKNSELNILKYHKKDVIKQQVTSIEELTPKYQNDMKILHDRVFPNTYYNGQQIVDRISPHKKVFIYVEEGQFIGYIHVEAMPEFGEGSIEFFAVEEENRGKGIGFKLITMAVQWLFSFESIEEIILCVNSREEKAINLYEKIGFNKKHELIYYTRFK